MAEGQEKGEGSRGRGKGLKKLNGAFALLKEENLF
jgi:hypothetical protein